METFEDVLDKFEPMIHACMRKLHIYKNYDSFKQAGRIALWKAWQRYDSSKGNFAPFAYRSIYGSLLDELKKTVIEKNIILADDELLEIILHRSVETSLDSERLIKALSQLNLAEQQLIHLLFVERFSLDKVALHFGITKAGVKKKRERTLQKLKLIMTT
ncbi:sigma-70 family RNA polymerase sigma factor [Paenisporosarcina macmurdoensis]|uniref:Sigma-70 family RNA polymerase sigma factor n=1 Tax=Paenisporosarcina macmurdoensis TaxID=212659 RepID=A0ABW1L2S4_9BACL